MPVPLRLTVCVPASSVIVRAPENDPTAAGAKETETVQEPPGAMLAEQVFIWLKAAAAVTVETCMGPVPVFVSVTVLAVLALPSTWEEKEKGMPESLKRLERFPYR